MGLIEADKLDSFKFKSASERMDLSVDYMVGWNEAIDHVQTNALTVNAEPVRYGRWINITNAESVDYEFACSRCGYTNFLDVLNAFDYCPHCGAKMIKRGVKYGVDRV